MDGATREADSGQDSNGKVLGREKHGCALRPRCVGSCDYERLACDLDVSRAAYMSMVENKIPVVRAGLIPDPAIAAAARIAARNRSAAGSSTGAESALTDRQRSDAFAQRMSVTSCECVSYPAKPVHTIPGAQ